jgi:hypothetical protein
MEDANDAERAIGESLAPKATLLFTQGIITRWHPVIILIGGAEVIPGQGGGGRVTGMRIGKTGGVSSFGVS